MCFSNLPLEFDEEGNPYLAEEAEDIERPNADTHDHDGDAVTGERTATDTDSDLATDPEGAFEDIVASLPSDAREHVGGEDGRTPVSRSREDAPESAEGD